MSFIVLTRFLSGLSSRALILGLVTAALSACSTQMSLKRVEELSSCPDSGKVSWDSIDIGSRSEHEAALKFMPADPENCLIYVVRGSDFWTGLSARRAIAHPRPADADAKHPMLDSKYIDQAREIKDDVYALWELRPGAYVLRAFLHRNRYRLTHSPPSTLFATVELNCQPSDVMFFSVGDSGYDHNVTLSPLPREVGIDQVRHSLRSVRGPGRSKLGGHWDCEGNHLW